MFPPRVEKIKDPEGSSSQFPLTDNHGRRITYLRLAITDRCNLRCRYCIPKQGVVHLSHDELLSYEELERLVSLFINLGISNEKQVRLIRDNSGC